MAGATAETADSLELRTPGGWIPLGFVHEPETIYLVARSRAAQWPIELLRTGRAEFRLPDRRALGTPRLVSEPGDRGRILDLFREKYGPEKFGRWYDHPARVLRVSLSRSEGPTGDGSPSYYAWLEAEFDNVAEDYDHHITGNRMNRLLRDHSLAIFRRRFERCHRLIEIGCGSGMETLPLLEMGHEVLAIDISSRMLATVRQKAQRAGVSERLETRQLAARELPRLVEEGSAGSFDAAYSTYGALNCEPDLSAIPPSLAKLLVPSAPFVAGVYNRWCLFELAGYSLSLRPGLGLSRRRNPVPVGASRFCVDVYAYSAGEFIELFRPQFQLEAVEGVPVFLPPSNLAGYAERFSRHFGRLAAWDARLGRLWPFNRLGDHFLMTYARRG